MNQWFDGDKDLQEPVGNPADEICGDHGKNDTCHFSVRTLFQFRLVSLTYSMEANENENVECCYHRDGKQKAK